MRARGVCKWSTEGSEKTTTKRCRKGAIERDARHESGLASGEYKWNGKIDIGYINLLIIIRCILFLMFRCVCLLARGKSVNLWVLYFHYMWFEFFHAYTFRTASKHIFLVFINPLPFKKKKFWSKNGSVEFECGKQTSLSSLFNAKRCSNSELFSHLITLI